jgi:hypothetical protein
MKKILVLLVMAVVLLGAAYVAGYWPQRDRLGALEGEKTQLQQRADAAEEKVRAGQLLGDLLALVETVEQMNYGHARGLSSPFFDRVRAEAGRATDPGLRQALGGIQQLRDPVTIALTQGDPAALNQLREAARRLRMALGYPAPAAPAATPLPPPTLDPSLPAPGTTPPAGSPAPGPTSPGPTPAAPAISPTANPLGAPTPSPAP